ncbi:hypothetical protein, partial [Sphingobacterium sp. MYb382]|uniref:hypothetical protein n=1 Tax=Sphingobacterium sp. MYb382 TaxID=2745278 RepID=UPI003099AD2B
NTEVKNILEQFINENAGNVIYNGSEFTYIDGSGNTQIIDLTELVKLAETVTTLVNNGDGTYTYTSENGSTTVIDVPADVINNFQEIVDNTEVKNILEQFINENAGNVIYNGSEFTYIDGSGNTQIIDLTELVKLAETVTTLVNNGDGTYTYTSENGSTTVIDVPADVINNFQEIVNNPDVTNILEQVIKQYTGNISFDGTNLTFVDGSGVTQTINIVELIKSNETVTTLVNDGSGVYTYTNEKGDTQKINVPADVINNFQEIVNNPGVTNILEEIIKQYAANNISFDGTSLTFVDGSNVSQTVNLVDFVKQHETITTIDYDDKTGVYMYNAEGDLSWAINVGSDVIKFFQDAVNNPSNSDFLKIFIRETPGMVQYDGDKLWYADASGVLQPVELKDETGGNVSYDINSPDQFSYVDESGAISFLNIDKMVKNHETITTIDYNEDNGVYMYNAEGDISWAINVGPDIRRFFQMAVNDDTYGNPAFLNNYIQHAPTNVSYNGDKLLYADGSGTLQEIKVGTINYSAVIQETGRKWKDGKPVKEVTFSYGLTAPSAEFILPAEVVANIRIIGVRVINNATNSISTILTGYDQASKAITVGLAGAVVGMHPIGSYEIILEYVER